MTFDINSWCELFAGKAQKTFGEKLLFIGLQGSYKRGEADDNSDIDIVVILKDAFAFSLPHCTPPGPVCQPLLSQNPAPGKISHQYDKSLFCILPPSRL